jgi:PAS domain S-box-containing protein
MNNLANPSSWPADGGETGALMRGHDWSTSPLGSPREWPQSLRSVVELLIGSKFPMFVAWGDELGFLYNDAYAEILGTKHPAALGARFFDIWAEIWPDISPLVDAAMAGQATYREDLPLLMNRRGFDEPTWFTFSYSPVRDDRGQIRGMFCAVTETTQRVLVERRHAFLVRLGDALRSIDEPVALTTRAAALLGQHLGVGRAGYGEIDGTGEVVSVKRDWTVDRMVSLAGQARVLDAFGPEVIAELRAGRTLVVEDCRTDPRTAHAEYLPTWESIGTRALIVSPLVSDGRLSAILYVHAAEPRRWADLDVNLVEEVATRTWDGVQRAQAEGAYRESEARLRSVLNGMGENFALLDPDFRIIDMNAEALRTDGRPREEIIGKTHWEVYPTASPELGELYRHAMAHREPVSLEHRYEWAHGRVSWIEMRAYPVGDGLAVFYGDITERVEAERRLRESEERFRELADNVSQLVWTADPSGWIYWYNKRWYDYTGTTFEGMQGWGWRDVHHPDYIDHVIVEVQGNWARGEPWEGTYLLKSAQGEYRWFLTRAEPIRNEAGELLRWFGTNTDISDQKRAEGHQRLLINELNHRVKNTLATVQSIASQTLRNAETTEDAREALESRLLALSRVHDVLTRENWDGADLRELVAEAVEPYSNPGEDRLHLFGETIRLPPRMALALAMALQELATNAVKYGALSNATGEVRIEWRDGDDRLHLTWSETGGPPVQVPTRRGFGTRLIERSLASDLNGEVRISFEPTGLICTVDAPITRATG